MTDRMEAAMSVEAPERIWIESEGGYPYFYYEEELSDVGCPVTEYVRADKLRAKIDAPQAEVERLRTDLMRLRTDLMESDEICEKLRKILVRTAAALKGEPPAGVWHSWHDLPEKATQRRVAGAGEMSMEAKQTPLIELLERVPQDARVVVEHDQFSSSSHPVGRLCHEAASELRRLHAQAAQDEALLRQALEWMVRTTGDTLEIPGVTHPSLTAARAAIAALRERLGEKA